MFKNWILSSFFSRLFLHIKSSLASRYIMKDLVRTFWNLLQNYWKYFQILQTGLGPLVQSKKELCDFDEREDMLRIEEKSERLWRRLVRSLHQPIHQCKRRKKRRRRKSDGSRRGMTPEGGRIMVKIMNSSVSAATVRKLNLRRLAMKDFHGDPQSYFQEAYTRNKLRLCPFLWLIARTDVLVVAKVLILYSQVHHLVSKPTFR